ncbi:MAG TPA: hypothetical protein VEW03_13245, partial [Longimicrobiaceae bacterium]|nr:hypothetical protein [Longimicrobiaceae bacterium]
MTSTSRSRTLLTALLAPALLLAGCAKDADDDAAPPADSVAAAAPAPPAAPAATVTDPQIAMIVVTANAVDSTGGEQA